MLLKGQLQEAQFENLTSDPSNLPDGRVWLNTTSNRAKAYVQGATRIFVTEDQTQTLSNKTISHADGSLGAPSITFTSDTDTGMYRVGANDVAIVAGGHAGLDIKDNGTYANVGMGGSASASSNYPLLIQRSNASSGTYMQISNPDTSAASKATYQLAGDNGLNTGEVSVFTAATTTDAYAGRMTVRASDSTSGLSLIAGDGASNNVRIYTGGTYTSAGRALEIGSEKTITLPQSVAPGSVSTPSSGLTLHNDSGVLKSKNSSGTARVYATLDGTETLTNKSISGSQVNSGQVAIANGGTGQATATAAFNALHPMTTTGDMIYSSSGSTSARLAVGSSNQILKVVGGVPTWGAAPSGGINYVSANPDAETDTSSWATYDDAAATPVDLTGGTFSGLSRSTSSPLRGTGTFLFTPSAIGKGVAFTITPDRADYGQVVEFGFDAEYTTATAADGDYTCWVYDVANSVLIQPTPYRIPGAVTGYQFKHKFTFQLPTNATTLRVAIHQTTSTTAALKFDNIYCSAQVKSYGPYISDWTSCTITGSWVSNSTYTAIKRRFGDSYEYRVKVLTSGAPTSASLTLTLDSTIDTTKISTTSTNAQVLGTGQALDSGVAVYPLHVVYNNSTTVVIYAGNAAGTYTTQGNVTQAVPFTFGASDEVNVEFKVPVVGLSSGMLLSSDADTRLISTIVRGSSTSLSASYADVVWTNIDQDTTGSFSSASYTVPCAGTYDLAFSALLGGTFALNTLSEVQVLKNGSQAAYDVVYSGGAVTSQPIKLNASLKCVAGDVLKIQVRSGATSPSFNVSSFINTWAINKRQSPSQIAASESVNARYSTSAGQSITNGSVVIVDFGTKDIDSHNAVTTGASWKFTAPCAGKFKISAQALYALASFSASNLVTLYIYKNGSAVARGGAGIQATASQYVPITVTDIVSLNAGDYIDIRTDHAESAARSLNTTITWNHVDVARIGN